MLRTLRRERDEGSDRVWRRECTVDGAVQSAGACGGSWRIIGGELLVVIYTATSPCSRGSLDRGRRVGDPHPRTGVGRARLSASRVSAAGRGLLPAPPPDPGPRGGPAAGAGVGA